MTGGGDRVLAAGVVSLTPEDETRRGKARRVKAWHAVVFNRSRCCYRTHRCALEWLPPLQWKILAIKVSNPLDQKANNSAHHIMSNLETPSNRISITLVVLKGPFHKDFCTLVETCMIISRGFLSCL